MKSVADRDPTMTSEERAYVTQLLKDSLTEYLSHIESAIASGSGMADQNNGQERSLGTLDARSQPKGHSAPNLYIPKAYPKRK
jgi:hypothetical protein